MITVACAAATAARVARSARYSCAAAAGVLGRVAGRGSVVVVGSSGRGCTAGGQHRS